MVHEGEDPLIQEEREDRGQPSPALSPLIQNIGAVMLLLTNLLAGQQEQQVAQRQLQMMQTEALSTALQPFSEKKFVIYLIQGIRNRQFSPGLIQNPPQTIQEFVATYGKLKKPYFAPPLWDLCLAVYDGFPLRKQATGITRDTLNRTDTDAPHRGFV
ncbi:Uncharacterized protein APZ42_025105 [Daphnia magna]|uniref:Uncharacterized protein n=1 Tax=Daphnia magna TaxID=35525 RepID=A0A164TH28_9CRUS|nr:Uncharacterized protein APZ42_025105 [Daphnia magna]